MMETDILPAAAQEMKGSKIGGKNRKNADRKH